MAEKVRQQMMCPVCGKATESIRDATIPYQAAERPGGPMVKFEMRLVTCAHCAPLVEKTLTASHARTRVGFHPLMLECLRAALINQERDPAAAAADEFASIYRESRPQN